MIKSIWIEIRPALKCGQVCVVLKKKLTCEVQITIRKSELLLKIGSRSFLILFEEFNVEPLTMTSLTRTNKFLSFRIQLECQIKIQSVLPPKLNVPVLKKKKSALFCQCYNPLTKEIIFDRVLPLPSSDFNLSNMFCHNSESSLPENILSPKSNDCFYSDHCIVVSEEILLGCKKKGKYLKCNRCLASIGTCSEKSLHFWITSLKPAFETHTPLEQFKYYLKKAVSDVLVMFPQILFESEEDKCYLLVIVIDKNLILSKSEENLELKSNQVIKLKFKYHFFFDAEIEFFKNDSFNICNNIIQVGKSFLEFCLKYLIECSKNIPPIFKDSSEKHVISYINLNN